MLGRDDGKCVHGVARECCSKISCRSRRCAETERMESRVIASAIQAAAAAAAAGSKQGKAASTEVGPSHEPPCKCLSLNLLQPHSPGSLP